MTDTKMLILDTAERLFAERGIQGVSVRAILTEAGVNMALAHYHFGSREGLILEVLRRRIEPMNEERLKLLVEAEKAAKPGKPSLEALLRGFVAPALRILDESPIFGRLAGQIHLSSDNDVRRHYFSLYEDVLRKYAKAIQDVLPTWITDAQRLCRGHFFLGALSYTLANYQDMEAMSRGRYEVFSGDQLVDEMVLFCTAGLLSRPGDGGERSDDDDE